MDENTPTDTAPFHVIKRRRIEPAKSSTSTREAIKGIKVVYYVKHLRHVKIGTTSDLRNRLDHLGAKWSDVLAIEFGSFALERSRHKQFGHLLEPSLGREHFRLGADLKDHIEKIKSDLLH